MPANEKTNISENDESEQQKRLLENGLIEPYN